MSEYQLVLLHAKWCHYCKQFNPQEGDSGDKLTWSVVKDKVKDKIKCIEFEEQELNEDKKGWDMDSIRKASQGWPTLLFVIKNNENDNYKLHSYFEGDRGQINNFFEAIDGVLKSEQKSILSGGNISSINKYRLKYKKYKQLYADLLKQYNELQKKQKLKNN